MEDVNLVFCTNCITFAGIMESKLLKLDPPYHIIYAGGKTGRHMATLMMWEEPEPGSTMLPYTASYPVIAQGNQMPQGSLVGDSILEDCRVVCREDNMRITLYKFAELVKFDFEQLNPVEAGHLWDQLVGLGVEMDFPKSKESGEEKTEFEVCLYFFGTQRHLKVDSNLSTGFCFHAEGSAEEVYQQLHYQHRIYEAMFCSRNLVITFETNDGFEMEQEIVDRLNQLHED